MPNPNLQYIFSQKIIAIVRGLSSETILALAEALYAGGIDLIEVTFDQAAPQTWPDTAKAIRALALESHGRILPGAGTVITLEQYTMARDAGAQYIITPVVDPALITAVKKDGLCAFPGAFTPTEIELAYSAGADAVKVFPAGALGPGYIKAVRAPLPHIPLMAVGGINEENAAGFLAAGAVGLGIGGNLVHKTWIENGEFQRITELAQIYRAKVDAV